MTSFIMSIWICVLALMLTSQSCHGGSVLTFSATPKSIKQNLTRTVTMRCEVAVNQAKSGSTDMDIESVANYWVTYGEDKYVASVEGNERAKGFIDEGNLRVSGSASGIGYLELTWDQPAAMRLGTYKCHVSAKSKTTRFVSLKKSLQLTSEEPSMTDLLERINKNEQDRKDADTKQMMMSCVTPTVGFMAVMTGNDTRHQINANTVIVFNKVLTDTTSSYDHSTGIFTSPVSGLYDLRVNTVTYDGHAGVQLWVNSNKVTSTVSSGDRWDSGSAAATVMLKKGDTVKVKSDPGGVELYQNLNMYQPNSFSGHLVASEDCSVST